MTTQDQIEIEQEHVSALYGRVDELRERAEARLAGTLRESGGTPQARLEREADVSRHGDELARYEAAEQGLCFGRLDLADGGRLHVGRIGLRDAAGEGEPLLVDWRAPAARPFYVATAARPEGARRRRHITTRGRRVVGVDDELLTGEPDGGGDGLVGEAALLSAVGAARTGRMGDIVATLQAEQDEIVRSPHQGVLVVQGGPGTGKTAVALHRAAYLLYTHAHLAARGVLVVGPNAVFLSYIGQVLPGLGETNVLLATVGELFPGVVATRAESATAAEVKGMAAMADVLAAAVADRQAPPGAAVDVDVAGERIRLDHEACRPAAELARSTRLPHNQARRVFLHAMLDQLAARIASSTRELADRLEAEIADQLGDIDALVRADLDDLEDHAPLGGVDDDGDVAHLRAELADDHDVLAALDALWPRLTPRQLLAELYADPERLARAAPGLAEAERASLLRAPGGGWTPADVPLLDEAAELLGVDDTGARARAAREREELLAYAQGVLDIAAGSRSANSETLAVADLIDADRLMGRHEERERRTVAERAAADRTWAFGHVIVDEAQELSPMAWRVLMRRCPTRSMTVVGDVAQTSDPAGAASWSSVLGPFVGDRWRLARLTVNYRTPAEIVEATAGLVADQEAPRAVRRTGVPPWRARAASLPDELAEHAAREAAELREGGGRLGVIVPQGRVDDLGAAVRAAVPDASHGAELDLTRQVVVLDVRQAKGLEFDSTLVADPAAILAASPRGRNDLYVALTRATQRLGVLCSGPAPAEIAHVPSR